MTDNRRFCQYCGTQLSPTASFCEKCGKPVQPGPTIVPSYSAPQAPAFIVEDPLLSSPPPPVKPARKGLVLPLVIIGITLVCCCAAAGIGGYATRDQWMPQVDAIAQSQTQTPSAPAVIEPTIQPTDTIAPVATLEPTATQSILPTDTALPEEVPSEPVMWQDSFSSQDTGWELVQSAAGYASYHEGFVFGIAIEQPDTEISSYPNLDINRPLNDVVVGVSGFKVEGDGSWGVMCRYTDDNNYYRLEIDGIAFRLTRRVGGADAVLTNPEWVETNVLDPNGYENMRVPVTLSCLGDSLQIEAGGYTVFATVDDSLPAGDFRIFATSRETQGDVDGYYIKVLFDDFELYAP